MLELFCTPLLLSLNLRNKLLFRSCGVPVRSAGGIRIRGPFVPNEGATLV
jgi:hypothetical protein